MKALRITLFVVLSLVAILAVLVLIAPKEVMVERSTLIDAPHAAVFDQMRHFAHFQQWSPWSALDPDMKFSISGTDGAVGARYAWEGNDQVGKGEMTMTSITPERIDIDLHFIAPFETNDKTYYELAADGDQTKVTWAMTSHMPVPMNVMSLLMNMDEMIGKDFEKGLATLKDRCESLPAPAAPAEPVVPM
ncbi:MAG: SRPBCC family protein [Bacteroidia bacterium]|nr:SRPBCC family protein [Bacteroidia bacterium]